MKLCMVALCCLLLVATSTEARRRRRNNTPRLRATATPPVVVNGFDSELTVDCRVKIGEDGIYPIYLLLQRINENGTVNMGLQMLESTNLMIEDNRTEAEGAIANENNESFFTLTISEPGPYDEGVYICQYLYLTPEVNTLSEAVNVTVRSIEPGEEYVPPPVVSVAEGDCCQEALDEIEKLKDALSSRGNGVTAPVAADATCQAAFSATLREERGYGLRSGRTVVFDTILTNKGDAYDVSNGKFTAPCDGQYYFTLTLTALHSTSGSVEGVIRRGTKNQARSFTFSSSYDEIISGSASVVLTLQSGEQVDVFLEATSDGEYIGGDRTVFSGYYLFP